MLSPTPNPEPEGWSTRDQIATHQLATSIINRHSADGTNYVFDAPSLATLKRFCMEPTAATREEVMREEGWGEPERSDGAGAAAKGSLVGYAIVKHGTKDPVFDERDMELLKTWFGEGMPADGQVVR